MTGSWAVIGEPGGAAGGYRLNGQAKEEIVAETGPLREASVAVVDGSTELSFVVAAGATAADHFRTDVHTTLVAAHAHDGAATLSYHRENKAHRTLELRATPRAGAGGDEPAWVPRGGPTNPCWSAVAA